MQNVRASRETLNLRPASGYRRSIRGGLGLGLLLALGSLLGVAAAPHAAAAGSEAKIMVVVPERICGQAQEEPASETELIRILLGANYNVVDQQQYASRRYSPEMDRVLLDPTCPEARKLTANGAATILIVGKANSAEGSYGRNGLRNARAELSVRAISVADNRILAAADETGSGADTSFPVAAKIALRHAAQACAKQLLPGISQCTGGSAASTKLAAPEGPHKTRLGILRFTEQCQPCGGNYDLPRQMPHAVAYELQKPGTFDIIEMMDSEQLEFSTAQTLGGLYESDGRESEAGHFKRPDFLVKGRISQFEVSEQHLGGGGGGLLGKLDQAFSKLGRAGFETARVRLQVEVVDASSGITLCAAESAGEARKAKLSGAAGMAVDLTGNGGSAAAAATTKAVIAAVAQLLPKLPAQAGGRLVCPNCQTPAAAGAKFCDNCGAKLQAGPVTCPSCHKPARPGAKFCSECQARL